MMRKLDREGEIQDLIRSGYIRENIHHSGELFIYNYTDKAMYEGVFTELTTQCRGLITDKDGNIVARPFRKFFNLDEHIGIFGSLPNEEFDVFEKLDGSLGILYFYDNKPYIATRGSFVSEQAQVATQMLNTLYEDALNFLIPNFTYLFEIIYPENRIVVDYKGEISLTLLAGLDTSTGEEFPIDTFGHLGFPIVKSYHGLKDINALKTLNEQNREGFVIRFKNGIRLKIKFQDYIKLHSIITEMSNKKIWEFLKEGKSFSEFVENIPDELVIPIREKELELKTLYEKIENNTRKDLDRILKKNGYQSIGINNEPQKFLKIGHQGLIKVLPDDRKAIALEILKSNNPNVLFAMLDGKNHSKIIWQLLEPEYEKPVIYNNDPLD